MKLSIKERIILLNCLPSRGDFTTMTIKKDIVDKIKITQEEVKRLKIKDSNGVLTWDFTKEKENEVKLTKLEIKVIKDELNKLDDKKELTDDTYNLFKIFNG